MFSKSPNPMDNVYLTAWDPICTFASYSNINLLLGMFFLVSFQHTLWNLKSAEFHNFLSKLSFCALAVLSISFYYIVVCYLYLWRDVGRIFSSLDDDIFSMIYLEEKNLWDIVKSKFCIIPVFSYPVSVSSAVPAILHLILTLYLQVNFKCAMWIYNFKVY